MGIEIELQGISAKLASSVNALTPIQFDVGDDGSIRGDCAVIDGVPIVLPRRVHKLAGLTYDTIGLELISRPYRTSMWKEYAPSIGRFLNNIPTQGNSSIHVHMDIANTDWKIIQEMCGWFLKLENVLYRLSSLGMRYHRGEDNSYRYMRPLSCPIHWSSRDRNEDDSERDSSSTPVIRTRVLLDAPNASKFFSAWGRLDMRWGNTEHYCPQRLHGLNLVPVSKQGTIELRIFNGAYGFLPEVIEICSAFYQLAHTVSYKDYNYSGPLGSSAADTKVQDILYNVLGLKDTKRLKRMWDKAEWCEAPEDQDLLHHYRYSKLSDRAAIQTIVTIGSPIYTMDNGGDFIPYWRSENV